MNFRLACAAFILCTALAFSGVPARAAQGTLADAQRDYNAGRFNRAVDALTAAIAKSPDDAPLQFLLGQCYYQLREFNRAIAVLERSVQLAGKQSEYHDWLGKAYGRKA